MGRRDAKGRLRERLVLGPIHAALQPDESVLWWGHVQGPQDGRHGILALTTQRFIVHRLGRDHEDVMVAWSHVTAWDVQGTGRGGPVLSVQARTTEVALRLPLSSRPRARRASALVGMMAELAPAAARPAQGYVGGADQPLRAERRGVRGHTRRILVTVAGTLLILLGVLFASPFLPGPGLLTILGGLAVLASEYDWARDLYHWLKGQVERFTDWRRARRQRRRAARSTAPDA